MVAPHLVREPRLSHWPDPPRTVHWCGRAPEIGVMVQNPAFAVIVHAGRFSASYLQIADQTPQRLLHLPQISRVSLPVVHFEIDICRPLAAPCRAHILVPDSLEVCRLAPWPGRRDQ